MLQTLIFDWDGTLHNTKALYGHAFRSGYSWLVSEGYAPKRYYQDEEVAIYLGISAPDMWETFMPQLPHSVKEQVSQKIATSMVEQIHAGNATLYPGATETLQELKDRGYRLIFLSNCKHAYMEAHRSYFKLDRFFDGYYCCEDYDFAPKTEIFHHIQKTFPGAYCVIGDRASDLEVGSAHNFPSIACVYGFGGPKEWQTATEIARNVSDLPLLVNRIANRFPSSLR